MEKKQAEKTIREGLKKIEDTVVEGYKKIENGVVDGYKKIETSAVDGMKNVNDRMIETFFAKDGETAEDARKRLSGDKDTDTETKDN